MRVHVLLLLTLASCGGDGGTSDDKDAIDETAVQCCPIDEHPSCNCFDTGGSSELGCDYACDVPRGGVRLETDENGCPEWVLQEPSPGACCGLFCGEPDTDTSEGDATSDVAPETSDETNTSETVDDARIDVEVVNPGDVDPILGWAGSIRIIEQLVPELGAGPADTYILVAMQSGPPVPYVDLVAEEGDCRLYNRPDTFCDPACTLGFRCHDDTCKPEPSFVSAGLLTFSGLTAALTATPVNDVRYMVSAEPPNEDLFADDALIGVSAAGAAQPAFTATVGGVTDLVVTVPSYIALYDSEAEVITWQPDGSDARVEITLALGWHGAPPESLIFCSAPDAAGQVTVSTELIKGFTYFQGGLFQVPSWAERVQRTVIQGANGPIELVSVSRTGLFVGHAVAPE